MNGQPKLPFYIALFAVVGGLIAYAAFKSDILAPKGRVQDGPGGGAKRFRQEQYLSRSIVSPAKTAISREVCRE